MGGGGVRLSPSRLGMHILQKMIGGVGPPRPGAATKPPLRNPPLVRVRGVTLRPETLSKVQEDGSYRLGIFDLAGVDAGEGVLECERLDLDIFIFVSMGFGG